LKFIVQNAQLFLHFYIHYSTSHLEWSTQTKSNFKHREIGRCGSVGFQNQSPSKFHENSFIVLHETLQVKGVTKFHDLQTNWHDLLEIIVSRAPEAVPISLTHPPTHTHPHTHIHSYTCTKTSSTQYMHARTHTHKKYQSRSQTLSMHGTEGLGTRLTKYMPWHAFSCHIAPKYRQWHQHSYQGSCC